MAFIIFSLSKLQAFEIQELLIAIKRQLSNEKKDKLTKKNIAKSKVPLIKLLKGLKENLDEETCASLIEALIDLNDCHYDIKKIVKYYSYFLPVFKKPHVQTVLKSIKHQLSVGESEKSKERAFFILGALDSVIEKNDLEELLSDVQEKLTSDDIAVRKTALENAVDRFELAFTGSSLRVHLKKFLPLLQKVLAGLPISKEEILPNIEAVLKDTTLIENCFFEEHKLALTQLEMFSLLLHEEAAQLLINLLPSIKTAFINPPDDLYETNDLKFIFEQLLRILGPHISQKYIDDLLYETTLKSLDTFDYLPLEYLASILKKHSIQACDQKKLLLPLIDALKAKDTPRKQYTALLSIQALVSLLGTTEIKSLINTIRELVNLQRFDNLYLESSHLQWLQQTLISFLPSLQKELATYQQLILLIISLSIEANFDKSLTEKLLPLNELHLFSSHKQVRRFERISQQAPLEFYLAVSWVRSTWDNLPPSAQEMKDSTPFMMLLLDWLSQIKLAIRDLPTEGFTYLSANDPPFKKHSLVGVSLFTPKKRSKTVISEEDRLTVDVNFPGF